MGYSYQKVNNINNNKLSIFIQDNLVSLLKNVPAWFVIIVFGIFCCLLKLMVSYYKQYIFFYLAYKRLIDNAELHFSIQWIHSSQKTCA